MSALAPLLLGCPDNDALMGAIVRRIEAAGVSVAAVGLDMTVGADEVNRARFHDALAAVGTAPIIGGFSLAARIAATIFSNVGARALLGFGYPFHEAGDDQLRPGLQALRLVDVPTRIIQGTRDPHGTEAEIKGYQLPDCVHMCWLPDGNHRYVPRVRSGFTHEEHIVAAADLAIAFVRSL